MSHLLEKLHCFQRAFPMGHTDSNERFIIETNRCPKIQIFIPSLDNLFIHGNACSFLFHHGMRK